MKTIALTQGYAARIDDEDYARLSCYKWRVRLTGVNKLPRAVGRIALLTDEYMSRFIMDAKTGEVVDHINGDTLDNRKMNLRICTNSLNLANRGAQRNNTSGYKGVFFCKQTGLWNARVKVQQRSIHLGRFSSKEAAAYAYNEKAKEYFGEYAKLNVIDYSGINKKDVEADFKRVVAGLSLRNTSGIKGVCLRNGMKKWCWRKSFDKKQIEKRGFDTKEEAALDLASFIRGMA